MLHVDLFEGAGLRPHAGLVGFISFNVSELAVIIVVVRSHEENMP